MFLFGMNCIALFIGYCVLALAAILVLAAVVKYIREKGSKK